MNSSREFRINGVFFSLTDRRGFIEACNDVFVRISGYTTAELTGQPHNIIRHPDMPRSVFQLFWEYLRNGQPVAAYVKNLAADGRYYWVLALAGPVGAKAQLQRPRDAQVVVVETSEAAADEAPPRPEMTGEDAELMRSVSEVS